MDERRIEGKLQAAAAQGSDGSWGFSWYSSPDDIDITSLIRTRRAFSNLAPSIFALTARISATDTSRVDSFPLLNSAPTRVARTDLVTE